jgi:hypothetical protein
VAAEIHRRGGYAVLFSANMVAIDMLATDLTGQRRVSIQVKSKQRRTFPVMGCGPTFNTCLARKRDHVMTAARRLVIASWFRGAAAAR